MTGEAGSWLLFADKAGVGEKLAQRLTARGERCTVVYATDLAADSREEMGRFLEPLLLAEGPPWRGVVHLWNLDAQAVGDSASLAAAQTPGCLSVVHMLQVWTEVTGRAGNASPCAWPPSKDARPPRRPRTCASARSSPIRASSRVMPCV